MKHKIILNITEEDLQGISEEVGYLTVMCPLIDQLCVNILESARAKSEEPTTEQAYINFVRDNY